MSFVAVPASRWLFAASADLAINQPAVTRLNIRRYGVAPDNASRESLMPWRMIQLVVSASSVSDSARWDRIGASAAPARNSAGSTGRSNSTRTSRGPFDHARLAGDADDPAAVEEQLRIDARPSDAISLALRTKSPIYVAKKVLEASSVLQQLEEGKEQDLSNVSRDKWAEILEKMAPDDFKYKM